MTKTWKKYSGEIKARIAVQAILEQKTINEISLSVWSTSQSSNAMEEAGAKRITRTIFRSQSKEPIGRRRIKGQALSRDRTTESSIGLDQKKVRHCQFR